jgi:lysophospholipase L1-like esterase
MATSRPQPRRALVSALLLSSLLLLTAPFAWGQEAARPTLPHVAGKLRDGLPLRIIAFGSSSTRGFGATSPAASYPSRLAIDLARALPRSEPVAVENRGISGEDADDMMRRLPAIIAQHPDLVIWQTGSNDPLRGVPLARFVADTTRGVQMMRAASIDVILMEPQWCRKLRAIAGSGTYTDAVRAVGAALGVPVVRRSALMKHWLADGLLTPAQMLAPDGLHMTDGGYAMLARVVARDILGAAPRARVMTAGAR